MFKRFIVRLLIVVAVTTALTMALPPVGIVVGMLGGLWILIGMRG